MALIQSLSTEAIIALVNAGAWPPDFPSVEADLAAINSAVAVDVTNASNVAFHEVNTGVADDVLGVFAFEGSVDSTNGVDGTWVPIRAARSNDATIETGRAAASLAGGAANPYGWQANVAGYAWFRIRCSTAVTATAIATWTINRSAYGTGVVGFAGTMTTTISGAPAAGGTLPVNVVGTVQVDDAATLSVVPVAVPGTSFQIVTTASTNATVIKASPGNLMEISIFNPTATAAFLKLYDKATAPTPGGDNTLLKDIIHVAVTPGFTRFEFGAIGKRFPAGISCTITALVAVTDTGNSVAGAYISGTYI